MQAKKYGLNRKGDLRDPEVKLGFSDCRRSVKELNALVIEALIKRGLPAVGLSPFGIWEPTQHATEQKGLVNAVAAALSAGLLPVIHGDAILDSDPRCSAIVSGDTVLTALAAGLPSVQHAVFLTDVPGVFRTWPPEGPAPKPIREIEVDEACEIRAVVGGSSISFSGSEADSTGGMQMKVRESAAIALGNCPVIITTEAFGVEAIARGPGVLALDPATWRGTVIRRRSRAEASDAAAVAHDS